MAASSSQQIQDLDYLYESNVNVSNFVSVKLSGKHNYHRWETQMLCLMETHYMRGLVDDAFVHGSRASSEKIRKQYDNLLKGWIFGSVSEGVLDTVVDRSSAKDVWDRLKDLYKLRSAEDVEPTMSSQQGPEEIETKSKYAISKDIEAGKDANSSKAKITSEEKWRRLFMYKDASEWSWWEIKKLLESNKDLLKTDIWNDGNTVLHMAVEKGQNDIVEKLLLFIKKEAKKEILEQKNEDGSTALHVAVSVGNKYAMKLLVDQHKDLLTLVDKKEQDPLIKAFNNMQFDTFEYLFKVAVDNHKATKLVISQGSKKGASLLVNAITAKQYSTARDLIERFPEFSTESDRVLMAIARTFPNELNYWETLIYPTLTNPTITDEYAFEDLLDQVFWLFQSSSLWWRWWQRSGWVLGSHRQLFLRGKQQPNYVKCI